MTNMKAMNVRSQALMAEHKIQQERRARYNFAYRSKKEAAKSGIDYKHLDEGLGVGRKVSYKGNKYFIGSAHLCSAFGAAAEDS